jgi:hypothetical protein
MGVDLWTFTRWKVPGVLLHRNASDAVLCLVEMWGKKRRRARLGCSGASASLPAQAILECMEAKLVECWAGNDEEATAAACTSV